MAEELENISPKAELIKQAHPKREMEAAEESATAPAAPVEKSGDKTGTPSSEKPVAPEPGKRRKVIVVKATKPPATQTNATVPTGTAAQGAAPVPIGQNKKLQPKIVVTTIRNTGGAAAVTTVKEVKDKNEQIEPQPVVEEAKSTAEPLPIIGGNAEKEEIPIVEQPPMPLSALATNAPATSAPAASAPAAGGTQEMQEKPAGLKEVATFQISQRPHVVAGRVGGRQVGPR
ncbi:MAG: hypothetical protein LBB61_04860, partial [Treponema sp.]|nr:hypothetical protein [Treponema sp.]